MGGKMPEAEGKIHSHSASAYASASTPAAVASSGFPPSAPPQQLHHDHPYSAQQYGTFESPSAPGEFPPPAIGFPQPAPPPGFRHHPTTHAVYPPHPYSPAVPYYAQGYQAVQGYIPVVEGRPVRMRRLPCCGLGMGWFLFIIGFFLAAIPWYIGAFVLLCVQVHDYREKPGYVACTIAAMLVALAVLLGVTKGTDMW